MEANQFFWRSVQLLYEDAEKVRFICAVADEYEFICPAPAIYYDPCTGELPNLIDRLHACLQFDFLIRHRVSRKAYLVDLQRKAFAGDIRLFMRERIAEAHIDWKGHDWQYLCVFEDHDIYQQNNDAFSSYAFLNNSDDRCDWLRRFLDLQRSLKPTRFTTHEYSLMDFLIHGILPLNQNIC